MTHACVCSHVCVSVLQHIAFVKMSHYILGQEAEVPLGSCQRPTMQHYIDQLIFHLASCFAYTLPFLWGLSRINVNIERNLIHVKGKRHRPRCAHF